MLSATRRVPALASRSLHTLAGRAQVGRAAAARAAATPASTASVCCPGARPLSSLLQLPAAALGRPLSTHAHKSHAHEHAPQVLVCGGNGALGQAMISAFKTAGWKTICMDYKANPASDVNITLIGEKDWKGNLRLAEEALLEHARVRGDTKDKKRPLAVVVHCAGSWMGGGADSLLSTADPMLDINLKSAISSSYLASQFLDETGAGLVVLTGAAAAANQSPTPGMLAYGMSKAATHHLATSLASKEGGMEKATVVCLLPSMIDTPSNRAMTSDPQEHENWTPPSDFAQLTLAFAQQLQPVTAGAAATGVPQHSHKAHVEPVHAQLQSGGFYTFHTKKGKTTIQMLTPAFVPETA